MKDMLRWSLAALLLMTLAGPRAWADDNALTDEEKKDGYKLLFNGKDFTGWKTNSGKPIGSKIEDGALVPYKSGGYILVYDKEFGDFVFECDVKMSQPKCNSGIFLRVGNLKNPVQTGLEVQVLNSDGKDMHSFGAIYDLVAPKKNVIKPDGWNHVKITAKGPMIEVEVNGEPVSSINLDKFSEKGKRPDGSKHKFGVVKDMPRKGYLGFQDHGQKCWYKNVKIKELDGEN